MPTSHGVHTRANKVHVALSRLRGMNTLRARFSWSKSGSDDAKVAFYRLERVSGKLKGKNETNLTIEENIRHVPCAAQTAYRRGREGSASDANRLSFFHRVKDEAFYCLYFVWTDYLGSLLVRGLLLCGMFFFGKLTHDCVFLWLCRRENELIKVWLPNKYPGNPDVWRTSRKETLCLTY